MQKGMTLVELLVTLMVTSIILAVGLPAYFSSIIESRRLNAQSSLLSLSSEVSVKSLYLGGYGDGKYLHMPNSEYYRFTFEPAGQHRFTVQAKAINSQTKDTKCQVMTIDQSLNRQPVECW